MATLEVAYVNQAAKVYVVEHGPSGDVLLTARDIYSGGSYPMMFVPSTANITIDIMGPTDMGLYRLCFDKLVSEQQTVIVDVCDKVKDSYPYGYNGQEKVNEWAGPGNFNDFAFRGQDTRTGRFISVDPLAKEFPWNSPYAFAENRVIDGIDLEGLEYATFTIMVDRKASGRVTSIKTTTDYELKSKTSNGPGVYYKFVDEGTGNIFDERFVVNSHGIYQGSSNPKLPEIGKSIGKFNEWDDDYSLPPIDEVDALAKQHDLDYDKDEIRGAGGVFDKKSTKANKDYIEGAKDIIKRGKNKDKDKYTGKEISPKTIKAAKVGKATFEAVESIKSKSTSEIKRDEREMEESLLAPKL